MRARLNYLVGFGAALLVAGCTLHLSGAIPFNKNLFSLSYVLMMGGGCSILLFSFWYAIDVKKVERPFAPLIWQGQNAIFVFVLCACNVFDSVAAEFYWKTADQSPLLLFEAYLRDHVGDNGASVLYACIKIVWWSCACGVLAHFKIFFKV